MSALSPLPLPNLAALETREVWAALAEAHRHLAELKGLCESLPNQGILLDTLGIQEAKDSSEIENIITTHDELYASHEGAPVSAAAKEVRHYVSALRVGYEAVRESGLIRLETVLAVQAELEQMHTSAAYWHSEVKRSSPRRSSSRCAHSGHSRPSW